MIDPADLGWKARNPTRIGTKIEFAILLAVPALGIALAVYWQLL